MLPSLASSTLRSFSLPSVRSVFHSISNSISLALSPLPPSLSYHPSDLCNFTRLLCGQCSLRSRPSTDSCLPDMCSPHFQYLWLVKSYLSTSAWKSRKKITRTNNPFSRLNKLVASPLSSVSVCKKVFEEFAYRFSSGKIKLNFPRHYRYRYVGFIFFARIYLRAALGGGGHFKL